jgi:hypothetical protein
MLTTTRLFIPPLGTRLELAQNWKFPLMAEKRNKRLWEYFTREELPSFWGTSLVNSPYYKEKYPLSNIAAQESITVELPAGTVLIVDRIYIRQGAKGFDSVSFRCESIPNIAGSAEWGKPGLRKKTVGRFWAKLEDVNRIMAKVDLDATLDSTDGIEEQD